MNGEEQLRHGRLSSWHWNFAPASVETNLNFTFCLKNRFCGFLVSVVLGATVSTVKVRVADGLSTLKNESVARTAKVCVPSASGVVVTGLLQAWKRAAVELALERHVVLAGLELEQRGVVVGPRGRPAVIVVRGAVMSRSS